MYKIREVSCSNFEPWKVSFEKRLSTFLKAKEDGFRIVLYLYEEPDTSTFRYRVYNICQSLELSLKWRGIYFFADEVKQIEEYIGEFDVIIAARYRWSLNFENFMQMAKKVGKRIGFDVDDLVYSSKNIPLIMNTLSVDFENDKNYDYWFSYTGRLEKVIHECDYIVTTNQFLREKLINDLHIPELLFPTI